MRVVVGVLIGIVVLVALVVVGLILWEAGLDATSSI
jgi:hypothetical protein